MERQEIVNNNVFLRCSVCGEVVEREIRVPLLDGSGGYKKTEVHCVCKCQREKKEAYEKRLRFEEEQRTINNLRLLSLMDARLKAVRFSNYKITEDNRKAFDIAKRYVDHFGEMFSKGQGILFWGSVGTGKSYTAAAIANELLEQMQSVIMTSFIKLLDEMSCFNRDDSEYIAKLNQAKLLIIDDLGAERITDFALEKVYDIIDSRYRSGKPAIFTTNLTMRQMKVCTDIRYNRIYYIIFDMCYPVKFDGLSWSKKEAAARFSEMKHILEG